MKAKNLETIISKQFDIDYPKNADNLNVGSIFEVYKTAFESAVKINKINQNLDYASQQLVGFKIGKWDSITVLIISMQLTKHEWNILKKKYPIELDKTDIDEIEEYFKSNKKNK